MSGLEHSLAPIELRENLSFTKVRVGEIVAKIKAQPEVSGCVLISTCNRTELYLSCEGLLNPGRILCAAAGVPYTPFQNAFVSRAGDEAARHLMEVAAGLRSRIWGEDQIISQVKTAIALAREQHAADPVLETLFRAAVSAGKEVKSRIRLTALSTSAAAQAVEKLRETAGTLEGKRAMVIGNGEMGRLAASLLHEAGCGVVVTLRSYHHGETVVPAGCGVVPYDERFQHMGGVDFLISATTSPHYTVTTSQLAELSHLPELMVDLAIPRDIQPQVGELPGVKLFNIDDLGAAPELKIPPEVEEILEARLDQFYRWMNYKDSLPAIDQLKNTIVRRVLTSKELEEGLDDVEIIELAVSRAVDLMAGGLAESITPDRLARCERKIRVHTTARPVIS
jgi:glutamyl-tRNA reductase